MAGGNGGGASPLLDNIVRAATQPKLSVPGNPLIIVYVGPDGKLGVMGPLNDKLACMNILTDAMKMVLVHSLEDAKLVKPV